MSFRLDAAVITTSTTAEFKQRLFIICDDCFWCASAINTRMHDIDSCPQCRKAVSSLPLSADEAYRYNYTPSRGIELEFYRLRK
jgi:hypothetical protein